MDQAFARWALTMIVPRWDRSAEAFDDSPSSSSVTPSVVGDEKKKTGGPKVGRTGQLYCRESERAECCSASADPKDRPRPMRGLSESSLHASPVHVTVENSMYVVKRQSRVNPPANLESLKPSGIVSTPPSRRGPPSERRSRSID